LRRIYTDDEVRFCRGRVAELAARFAAKEAVMKALGRGWSGTVTWLNIEVVRAKSGRPEIALHNDTAALAQEQRIRRFSLSMTHTNDHALAYVIAQDD
jgi:holo-[acyl-carrier protein] synthase